MINKEDFKVPMENRVIGLTIVKALTSNWNADFSGDPRSIMDIYVGSPFSLKFTIKKYWERLGERVLYIKSYKESKKDKKVESKKAQVKIDKLLPNNIEERIKLLFGNKEYKSTVELIEDIFTCVDATCFGYTVPIKDSNINSTGAVQYGMGINKFEEAQIERMEILSPFQNKEGAEQSTVGSRSVLSEGHFVYDFVITPWVYNEQKKVIKGLVGFSKAHYKLFKEASLNGVTNYNSVAKKDCVNELGLFVELKEGSLKMISANLNDLVSVSKDGTFTEIDLTLVTKHLKDIEEDIKNIELHFNPYTTKIKGLWKDDFSILRVCSLNTAKEIDFGAL